MRYETPAELLGRLKLGREEFCQRLLTSLILHAPYPKWNSRNRPSPQGVLFLRRLHALSFGEPWPGDDCWFVDEFELPARHDAEKGGAPDYAVLWDDTVWLVELKTERASHRADQCSGYFDLGHHHHPDARIDLTYLTPAMTAELDPPGPWARYAHVTWTQVAPLIRQAWPEDTDTYQQEVVDGLLDAIARLEMPKAEWLASLVTPTPTPAREEPVTPREGATMDLVERALRLAADTAEDGEQRALDQRMASLEDLLELRLAVRDAIAAEPDGSPLRRVRPWLWRAETSTGVALTDAGRETGRELRLSRYAKPS